MRPISSRESAMPDAMPDGIWSKCPDCKEILYQKQVEENLYTCPNCNKHFRIGEGREVQFRSEFFNFFNHPNDVNPNGTTGLQDLSTQTNEPRVIQFSARIQW